MEKNGKITIEDALKIEAASEAFYPCLKVILNDYNFTEYDFPKKVNDYVKSKNMPKLEKKLFDLILYLNPKKKNFLSEINRKLIINVLKYLMRIKKAKESLNIIKDKEVKEDIHEEEINKVNIEYERKNKKYEEKLKKVNELKMKLEAQIEVKAGYENVIKRFSTTSINKNSIEGGENINKELKGGLRKSQELKESKKFKFNFIKIKGNVSEYDKLQKKIQVLEKDINIINKTLFDEYKKLDKKIQEFVELGKKQEKELVELHNKKMEEYITKATAEYPPIKYSTEYLNGRLQESKLVKQERFVEAAQKKALIDKLQTKENEKYEADRSENINKSAESLGIKQEQDLNVLRARLARIYDLMTSKKEKDLETLDNKFKNKKQELIGNQMRQINITENANKDRAWEGSNKLIKMALKNKKENETLEKRN